MRRWRGSFRKRLISESLEFEENIEEDADEDQTPGTTSDSDWID